MSQAEMLNQSEGAARISAGLDLLKRITQQAAESAHYNEPHDDEIEGPKLDALLADVIAFVTEDGKDADNSHISLGGAFKASHADGEPRYVEWHFCIDVKDDADLALEAFGDMIGRLVESGKMDSLVQKMGGVMKKRGGPQSAEVPAE